MGIPMKSRLTHNDVYTDLSKNQEFIDLVKEINKSKAPYKWRLLVNAVERIQFENMFAYKDGNLSATARELGLTRTTLRGRLKEWDV